MLEQGMSTVTPRRHFGIVDHDSELRHSLLGAFQILCLVMLVGSTVATLAMPRSEAPRSFVAPGVLLVGALVQHILWRKRKDVVVAHAWVWTLMLVTVVGTFVNGLRSPAAITPLLTIVTTGYLLGKRAALRVSIASLVFLAGVYLATKWGWLATPTPPATVWARVLIVQMLVSTASLAIPLRGLLSGVALIETEKEALGRSVTDLEHRSAHLAQEVVRRTRELEMANSDLATFSFSLSHDLQTPLRSIQGFARNLESTPGLSLRQKDLLDRIRHGSARLDSDIRQILTNAGSDGRS